MELSKYSFGIGDRFAKQGDYQLKAFEKALAQGVEVIPVWNKSYREHKTVGSQPESVRKEADTSVQAKGWKLQYLVDADHINLENVDAFIPHSDFFTIDVAKYIGKPADAATTAEFKSFITPQLKPLKVKGMDNSIEVSDSELDAMCSKFLQATVEAANIHQYILAEKKGAKFFTEVSIDEVEDPQNPVELFVILAALAFNHVPVDTIAPKFTGRFNKGVDYEGDLTQFKKEFEADILVIRHAIEQFNFSKNLKLSVHTGSDKFSLYPVIGELIKKYDTGLHLKTAGTTWLEELIGLAESDGEALEMAKSIYKEALSRYNELTDPYSTVIHIEKDKLPTEQQVDGWSATEYTDALRHDQKNKGYNRHMRQLLHTSYKLAAERGVAFTKALEDNASVIGKNVTENIYARHLKPLFNL